jgi:hypothetical protein
MTEPAQLEKAGALLRNVFIERPVPSAESFDDLDTPCELLDRYGAAVRRIAEAGVRPAKNFWMPCAPPP